MLRRLSRSQNTVFCGRILVFLAKFFPVSERSGLNIISEFNSDNITVFSQEPFPTEEEKAENEVPTCKVLGKMTDKNNKTCFYKGRNGSG